MAWVTLGSLANTVPQETELVNFENLEKPIKDLMCTGQVPGTMFTHAKHSIVCGEHSGARSHR